MNYVLSDSKEQKSLVDAVYPVGSVYISLNPTSPASFLGGQWQALDGNQTLWTTAWNADTTKELTTSDTKKAGLPNIEGAFYTYTYKNVGSLHAGMAHCSVSNPSGSSPSSSEQPYIRVDLNASWSNSIYGNSDTVQPPAQCVYMWKRTA